MICYNIPKWGSRQPLPEADPLQTIGAASRPLLIESRRSNEGATFFALASVLFHAAAMGAALFLVHRPLPPPMEEKTIELAFEQTALPQSPT
jgi:hypothetical protein